MVLNGAQRSSLLGTLEYIGGDWANVPLEAMEAMERVLSDLCEDGFTMRPADRTTLQKADVLDSIQQCREIVDHPCPQNRSTGSPYCRQDPGFVNFYDDNHTVTREPEGKLSLTNLNRPPGVHDSTTGQVRYPGQEPCSKLDVMNEMGSFVTGKLADLRKRQKQEEQDLRRNLEEAAKLSNEGLMKLVGQLQMENQGNQRTADQLKAARQKVVILTAEKKNLETSNRSLQAQVVALQAQVVALRTEVEERQATTNDLKRQLAHDESDAPPRQRRRVEESSNSAIEGILSQLEKIMQARQAKKAVRIMSAHSDVAQVQEKGCAALSSIAYGSEAQLQTLVDAGGVESIVKAMAGHSSSSGVQEHGCGALTNIAAGSEAGRHAVVAAGGVDSIVKAMAGHSSHSGVQLSGCKALYRLAHGCEARKQAILDRGGAPLVRSAMRMARHHGNSRVQEVARDTLGLLGV